jgi:tripartite-type tricarboxylate transporter receptor subunit TctC
MALKHTHAALAALLLSALAPVAIAQAFPAKPVRAILPYAAGGLLEVTVRTIGQAFSEGVGQPLIVEPRPGGSTFIGMVACKDAAPDGYTICVTTGESLSYNPHLFKNLPYDPERDFAPVTNLAFPNNIIVASAKAPFNTYRELIAYAKANPGKVNYGTWGPGSTPHLYLEAINRAFNIDIAAVPYKGAGQAYPAIVAGEVDVTFGGLGFSMPFIKSGKLKPLVISPFPSSMLPDVPAMKDIGGEPATKTYFGMFAPGRTPKPVLDRLSSEFAKALKAPKIQEFLAAQTLVPVGNTPEEFAAFVKADREGAGKLFKEMGITAKDAP